MHRPHACVRSAHSVHAHPSPLNASLITYTWLWDRVLSRYDRLWCCGGSGRRDGSRADSSGADRVRPPPTRHVRELWGTKPPDALSDNGIARVDVYERGNCRGSMAAAHRSARSVYTRVAMCGCAMPPHVVAHTLTRAPPPPINVCLCVIVSVAVVLSGFLALRRCVLRREFDRSVDHRSVRP